MDWQPLVSPLVAAAAALLGVHYGVRSAESRESHGWTRDQRLRTYADLLDAMDRAYGAFALINAALDLARYQPAAATQPRVRAAIDEWGRWDAKIEEYLPRAELVASEAMQVHLSVGVRLGIRSRHRFLLMKLDFPAEADEAEWRRVARMTLDDLERVRTRLRADISRRDVIPGHMSQIRRRARVGWRRIRHEFDARRHRRAPEVPSERQQA
jgi:hypothetical protein